MLSLKVPIDVPCTKIGEWEVKEFEVTRQDAAMHSLGEWFNHGSRHIAPGKYKALMHGVTTVMSNTPSEIADHVPFISRACGDILVNGLGLGMVVAMLLKNQNVSSITIVEKESDVIALVAPTYLCDSRVKIFHDDAFYFKIPPKPERYDAVWHDIWNHISADNLPEMARLHRKYSRRCWWQDCWCRQECLRQARQERTREKARRLLGLTA